MTDSGNGFRQRRFFFKASIVSVLTIFFAVLGYAEEQNAVSHVMNGDKFNVSSGDTVRLLCVRSPDTARYLRKSVDPMAKQAIAYTRKEFEDQEIKLEFDSQKNDPLGSLLAYVYRKKDNLFLNAELLKSGMAQLDTTYPCPQHLEEFKKLEQEAKAKKIGIWNPKTEVSHDQAEKKS